MVETQLLEADVVVVGAGPGGSTVARELTRAGLRVVLVEKGGRGRPVFLRSVAIAGLTLALAAGGAYQAGIAFALLFLLSLHRPELFPGRRGTRALYGAFAVCVFVTIIWVVLAISYGFGARDVIVGVLSRPLTEDT